jgi:hypothetical protein
MRIRRILGLAFGLGLLLTTVAQAPAQAKPDSFGTCHVFLLDDTPPPPGPNGLPKIYECYY